MGMVILQELGSGVLMEQQARVRRRVQKSLLLHHFRPQELHLQLR